MGKLVSGLLATLIAAVGAAAGAVGPATAAGTTSVPSYQVARQVSMPGPGMGVAVDSSRGLVYVAGRWAGEVWVYDEATLTLQHTIPVPNEPFGIAVGPTGFVYVTRYTDFNVQGTVSVIDPATNAVVATLPVGATPTGVTVSRDGSRLYVGNLFSTFLSVFDLTTPAAPVAMPSIPLPGIGGETITESVDGSTLFVPNSRTSVFVVDTGSGTVSSTWAGLDYPHQVSLSTDGSKAFVSQQRDAPMPTFDIATNTKTGTLPLPLTYYQTVDTKLGAGFITQPFTKGGTIAIINQSDGSVIQELSGILRPYIPAVDPRTHSVFVTTMASDVLTKVTPVPPVVTTDPASQTITDGSTATFTAAVTGTTPFTVQWQSSTDGGTSWTDIPAATGTSYTTPTASLSETDTQFRAVFTDAVNAEITTAAATLTVLPLSVTVTTNPTDQTVAESSTATFTAAASGSAPIAVQWQTSTDGGTTWTDITGATGTTYTTPTTTTTANGTLFRAVFSGPGINNTASTTAARLTVTTNTTPAVAPTQMTDPAPTPRTPKETSLANTGGDISPLSWVAALLLVLGSIATITAARRHQ